MDNLFSEHNDKVSDESEGIEELETFEVADDFELLSQSEISGLDVEELEELGVFEEFSEILFEPGIQEKIPMVFRLTRRFVVFLSFMMISFLTIFFIGNEQHFLDSDLKLILTMNTVISIMLALMCVSAFVECIICTFIEKKIKYLFYEGAFVIVFVLACISSFFGRSINLISDGFFN